MIMVNGDDDDHDGDHDGDHDDKIHIIVIFCFRQLNNQQGKIFHV